MVGPPLAMLCEKHEIARGLLHAFGAPPPPPPQLIVGVLALCVATEHSGAIPQGPIKTSCNTAWYVAEGELQILSVAKPS